MINNYPADLTFDGHEEQKKFDSQVSLVEGEKGAPFTATNQHHT
jgi:hypothetical protein